MTAARSADLTLEVRSPVILLGLFISLLSAAIAILSAARGEYVPALLIAGAVAIPFVFVAGFRALAWEHTWVFQASVVLVFLQSAIFRLRDIEDKSIDGQILLKLACIGLMGAMTATAIARGGDRKAPSGTLLWAVFLVYSMLTSAIAVRPDIALVETLSHIAAFGLLYGLALKLGRDSLVNVMIVAASALCAASIFTYFAVPGLGRMSDWVNGAFVPISRLQGVFGTANAAGAAAATAILFTVLFSNISKRTAIYWLLIGIFAFCLIMSNNRMAQAGCGAALLYVFLARGHATIKAVFGLLGAGLLLFLFAEFSDEIFTALSRSGEADEITSGTGRTRIWAIVIDLWMQKPLLGYGAGSAKFILPSNELLFKAAAHPHNMYLNVLFHGGIVGLAIFLAGLLSTIRRAWNTRAHDVIGMMIFFLLYGITEPAIGGLVSFVSMSFYAAVILSLFPQRPLAATDLAPLRR